MAGDIFSKVFSLCPDAISISRLQDGLILAINEGFTRLTGYAEADVRGKTAADLQFWVNPEDRRHLLERLRAGGEVRDFTAEFKLKSGLTKPGSLSARLVADKDGECLLCYIRDLSERAMAEDALRQYHEAAFMLENAPIGIYIAQNGLLIYGNQWLREFCGIPMSGLPRDPLSVVVPEDRPLVREQMLKRMRGEDALPRYTVRLPRPDGTVAHVDLIAKVMTYRGQPAIQGSIVDVSEKIAAENHLRRYAAELEESNKLRQLFNDILSHDLLDPLWAASGQADLLAARAPEEFRGPLGSIQAALGEAREILGDAHAFLQLRDEDGPGFADLDVAALLREVAASFEGEAGRRGIAIELRLPRTLRATASPILRQAFANLVSNALKYGPEGAAVTIEAENGPALVQVAVRNRGERIPEEFRQRVFERFVQGGKRGIKGVGLGLAIVRRIAELHGGHVRVEDDPGGGSVFFFVFPRQPPLAPELE
ncbi:MAG: sensor histidine kinase [Candidatus Methylomirabilia bacterium]